MASQVTNYQCPACTGPLHFDSATGKMKCDYCGTIYELAEIEAMYAEKEKAAEEAMKEEEGKEPDPCEAAAAGMDWGDDADGMRAYSCPSCGAQLICDETTAATSCPYCGNPTVVPGQFGGTKRPDYVIPFKLTKENAEAALKAHYKGKVLLPNSFKSANHIREIKGVYVPFWLFDAEAYANMMYHGTRSRTYKEGDYRVTDTDHFQIHRAGTVEFAGIPVDGSSKMPNDYMDSIAPYNYEELREFSTAYLPGFLADKYDETSQEVADRARRCCENSALNCIRATVSGYETVTTVSNQVNITEKNVKYALMPVWVLSTRWNGQNYLFAMNGQTGKMVGDLPVDRGKYWTWLLCIMIPLAVILSIFFSGSLGDLIGSLFH